MQRFNLIISGHHCGAHPHGATGFCSRCAGCNPGTWRPRAFSKTKLCRSNMKQQRVETLARLAIFCKAKMIHHNPLDSKRTFTRQWVTGWDIAFIDHTSRDGTSRCNMWEFLVINVIIVLVRKGIVEALVTAKRCGQASLIPSARHRSGKHSSQSHSRMCALD